MRIPAYRKHSNRDYAFVEWQGERRRLPGTFNSYQSREAYKAFLREVVHAPAPPVIRLSRQPVQTVGEIVLLFLDEARKLFPGVRSEYGNYKTALIPFAEQYASVLARDFGPLMLKDYRDTMAHKKLARSYINGTIGKIRRVFKWAVSEEHIPVTIYQALLTLPLLRAGRTDAKEAKKKSTVSWAHVCPVLREVSATVKAMIVFQWHTGARSGSICRATPEQFDTRKDLWEWRPRHKTELAKGEIVLHIGRTGQKILRPFLKAAAPGEFLFQPGSVRNDRRYGPRYTSLSYRTAVRRAIDRINRERDEQRKIPLWSPHQLRHTKGHMVRERYGLEAAQAVLAHDSIDTTQLYSERLKAAARKVALETG